jgi:hypothetical protein
MHAIVQGYGCSVQVIVGVFPVHRAPRKRERPLDAVFRPSRISPFRTLLVGSLFLSEQWPTFLSSISDFSVSDTFCWLALRYPPMAFLENRTRATHIPEYTK